MILDGFYPEEESLPYHYVPQGKLTIGYRRHGELYYRYTEDTRGEKLRKLAERMPELSLAAACVETMGLSEDCVELAAVDFIIDRASQEVVDKYRRATVEHLAEIRRRDCPEQTLRRLYFEMILPVAAAVDAGETMIARAIYADRLAALIADNS